MKQIDKIVKGIVEPKDINVLWLDTNDPKSPILKAYADGKWEAISSGEGGGGSAEGAVSYEPQELTDEQKMQARKNQGLYYTEGEGEKDVIFEVICDDEAHIPNLPLMGRIEAEYNKYGEIFSEDDEYFKVQDEAPNVEEISSYVSRYVSNGDENPNIENRFSIEDAAFIHQDVGWYGVFFKDSDGDGYKFIVVTDDTANVDCIFEYTDINSPWYEEEEEPIIINNVNKGVWMTAYILTNGSLDKSDWELAYVNPNDVITQTLTYGSSTVMPIPSKYVQAVMYSEEQELTQMQKMQARLNQDLYAKNPDIDINLSWEWDGSDNVDNLVYVKTGGTYTEYYCKIANDNLPDLSAIINFVYTSVIGGQVYTRYPIPVNNGEYSWTSIQVGNHPFGNLSELLSGTMHQYQPGEDNVFLVLANEASVRLTNGSTILMNGLYVYADISTNNSNYSYVSNIAYTISGEVVNPIEPEYQKPYVVRFTTGQNNALECSATYEEIMKAFDTGAVIIGEYYDRNGELIGKTRNVSIGFYDDEMR